jgi:hypothetical protein
MAHLVARPQRMLHHTLLELYLADNLNSDAPQAPATGQQQADTSRPSSKPESADISASHVVSVAGTPTVADDRAQTASSVAAAADFKVHNTGEYAQG